VKINQVEKDDIKETLQLNTDMIAEMMQDSETIKNYLDNIMIVGALKGYRIEQKTKDFTFWTKHTVSLVRDGYNVHCTFTVKKFNKIENFEVRVHISELRERLLQHLGIDIKMVPGDVFFSYHHEGILKMLEILQEFIVSE